MLHSPRIHARLLECLWCTVVTDDEQHLPIESYRALSALSGEPTCHGQLIPLGLLMT